MLTIYPVPAFNDNYIWTLYDEDEFDGYSVVVDPGDAQAVEAFVASHNSTLRAILVTHHHADHTGGIAELTARRNIPVYGPAAESIAGVTHPLRENDRISFPEIFDGDLRVLEVPGHTRGHIAYVHDDFVLCGDTMFAAGCGRLFEGSPAQMHTSLNKLAKLPPATRVYCTHEYTLANLRFASTVEPNNPKLAERMFEESEKRAHNQPTVPTTIARELETNPFLRVTSDEVIESASKFRGQPLSDPVDVFAAIREWKDGFR